MRAIGLGLFLVLSLAGHLAAAFYFGALRDPVLEERGAGSTALEIGALFDSMASEAVAPNEIEEAEVEEQATAEPRYREPLSVKSVNQQTVPIREVTEVASAKPIETLAPATVSELLPEELTANDELTTPDILKPRALEPVKFEKAITEATNPNLKPVEPQEAEEVIKETVSLAQLPQRKAPPPVKQATPVTQKQTATKVKPKTARQVAKTASQASAASRKGGQKANAKGTKGAVGGDGGKKKANGTALTTNYMGNVRSRVARKQRYPASSKRKREKGTAVIRFVVASNGGLSGLRLVRSSGSGALDQAALDMAKRAAPFPPIPAGTGKQSITFTLPISFAPR
ncbi:energy transducer TonB [uncultured Cohaesibacter sp.]|uniref:energy transducer TonB family protein n=1 Tax=uncultured Cohaesibacter sp. TaxID=1002546 RepID=UPI0029C76D5B|nr:energy transducer TonB [uncultured Cohaesibacter sp.]